MMNGRGGRMRPIVAAGDRHGPAERSDVPVDARRHQPARVHPDPDLSAMILAAFGGVQRHPDARIGELVDLSAYGSAISAESGGIGAQVEQQSRYLSLADILRPAREKAVQSEAAHQGPAKQEQL